MSKEGLSIDALLRSACEAKASDLHLKVGNHPYVRVNGELRPLTQYPCLSSDDTRNFAFGLMSERQKEKFQQRSELDMPYEIPGLARFRCNVFHQRGRIGMVFRVVPTRIQSFAELSLPPVLEKICQERRGLVLVAGTTGCGKSTTLAAMVEYINSSRADHIVTIEDPIEFYHPDKKGFVNQREVEVDTPNFAAALRAALRQDPDVILVGEMRDLETIHTAMLAAETGHLVFSTLHTTDAAETVQRIIAVFHANEQKQIRLQLASVLKGVICQRLVRRADGLGRVPAVEVLVSTEYIRDCIVNPEKTRLIREALAAGLSQYGMQTFDQSLYDLHTHGLITLDAALANSSNPDEFKLRLAGIRSAADGARDDMEKAVKVERFAS
jgi:twitching motility protein PilT